MSMKKKGSMVGTVYRSKAVGKKKPKGGKGGTKCLMAALMAVIPASYALAQATQCQVFSDGAVVCYPTGGSSTYGK